MSDFAKKGRGEFVSFAAVGLVVLLAVAWWALVLQESRRVIPSIDDPAATVAGDPASSRPPLDIAAFSGRLTVAEAPPVLVQAPVTTEDRMPQFNHLPLGWRDVDGDPSAPGRWALFYDPAERAVVAVAEGDMLGAFVVERLMPEAVSLRWRDQMKDVAFPSAVRTEANVAG